MPCDPRRLELYLVTDRRFHEAPLVEQVARAIAGGVTCVQLREKDLETGALVELAGHLADLCRAQGVTFIVNDRIDVAMAVQADGVHLGRKDMPLSVARRLLGPDRILGATAGNIEQARQALAAGADYLGVGAIAATSTKADHNPVIGVAGFGEIAQAVALPCVAIAGVDRHNAADLIRAGGAGIAVVSAILGAADITQAAGELKAALGAARRTP